MLLVVAGADGDCAGRKRIKTGPRGAVRFGGRAAAIGGPARPTLRSAAELLKKGPL